MARLDDFLVPVRQMPRADFASKNPHPFLLWRRADSGGGEQAWSFKTQTVSQVRAMATRSLTEEGISLAPEVASYEAFAVVKTQANPWRDRISIGRARNNDIVLLDSSVSKLHAHIILSPDNDVTITDAGSRNGTQVGGKAIPAGEQAKLQNGTQLVIGRLEMVYLSAEGLHDFINKNITTSAR